MADTRRLAVVTGGGRGIGRGIVLSLAERGFVLAVNYRKDREAAESACREAERRGSPHAEAVCADVSDQGEGRRLLDTTMGIHGRIDVWVNNAGIAPLERLDLLETTPESWDRVLNTNLKGPFFLTQAVASAMIAQPAVSQAEAPQIIFIGSISSIFASVNRAEYCVAKAGLGMVAQLFAVRLAGAGIRVYEIRPGLIETEMTAPVHDLYSGRIDGGLTPICRWGTPDDVGRAVAAIATGAFPYSTGATFYIDGGMHARML